jgi:hypothetical protein
MCVERQCSLSSVHKENFLLLVWLQFAMNTPLAFVVKETLAFYYCQNIFLSVKHIFFPTTRTFSNNRKNCCNSEKILTMMAGMQHVVKS